MKEKLSPNEISVIKGIIKFYPEKKNQDILNMFSIPNRTINAGRISEIRNGYSRFASICPASKEMVNDFLSGEIPLNQLMQNKQEIKMFADLPDGVPHRLEKVFCDSIQVNMNSLIMCVNESECLDFKVNYEPQSVHVYLKTLVGMVNAQASGGLLFGVDDGGKILGVGKISKKSIEAVSKQMKEYFAPFVATHIKEEVVSGKRIVLLHIAMVSGRLPVICKKTRTVARHGKDETILEEGSIYCRYGSDTVKIRYSELVELLK